MPRRFLTSAGEQVDPSIQERFEADLRAQLETDQEIDPVIGAILQKIDFNCLKEILLTDARHSGVTDGELNFIERERIKTISESTKITNNGIAEYSNNANIIRLDSPSTRTLAKRFDISEDLLVLMILCHEETHATGMVESRGVIEGWYNDLDDEVLRTAGAATKTGVSSRTNKLLEGELVEERLFDLLEEGIVEKSAQETFAEYLRRNPDFAATEEIKKFYQIQKNKQNFGIYPAILDVVGVIISLIGKEAGVSEEVAWQGMKRAHYEGENLLEPELRAALAKVLGEPILKRLVAINSEKDMEHLILDMLCKEEYLDTPAFKNALKAWARLYVKYFPKN